MYTSVIDYLDFINSYSHSMETRTQTTIFFFHESTIKWLGKNWIVEWWNVLHWFKIEYIVDSAIHYRTYWAFISRWLSAYVYMYVTLSPWRIWAPATPVDIIALCWRRAFFLALWAQHQIDTPMAPITAIIPTITPIRMAVPLQNTKHVNKRNN